MSPAGTGMKLICPIMIELDMANIPTIITFFDEIRGLDHRSIIGRTPLEPKVLLNHAKYKQINPASPIEPWVKEEAPHGPGTGKSIKV
jgi:hypothetical protein